MSLNHRAVHKALASDTRRLILLNLKQPKYLSELSKEISKSPQTVDFHLKLLEEINLVESNWQNGKKYYNIKDRKILDFIEQGKALPESHRPKPHNELMLEILEKITKKLEKIEKKLQ